VNPRRILELVRKEFIVLFRDPRNRRVLFMAPVIQILIFGYVVNYDIENIRLALFDQSRTTVSRDFVDAFEASPVFTVAYTSANDAELEDLLLDRKVDLGLKIPPDFAGRIRSGGGADVQIIADGTQSNMAAIRLAYTQLVIAAYNERTLRESLGGSFDRPRIDDRIRTLYNPNLTSRFFFVPGIVAFIVMLISLLLTSIAVIREREQGTLEQLLVTPLGPLEMILGKTIPYIAISLVQMAAITLFAKIWFGVPLAGSAVTLLAATCLFLLSTLGIGLFISTVSATQQQAMMTTFFVMLPAFMLSGFIFPIANMPLPVRAITYVNPLRHYLEIIRGIFLKGVGMEVMWLQFVELAVLGLVFLSGAVMRFHKRLDE